MKRYIVFDIGGSSIKFALMDEFDIHFKGKIKTPIDSLDTFIDTLERIYDSFTENVVGVAVSMPGLIDSATGFAVHGGALQYIQNSNIAELIYDRLKVPVRVENDGKSAALGEVWKGHLNGVNNAVVFVLGTGIGGGIIANGELLKGEHFGAGEFSFICTDSNNLLDTLSMLGRTGSAINLVKMVAETIGEDPELFEGEDMFNVIREGNKAAITVFNAYCELIASQILNLQSIIDPEMIILGGGISSDPLLISHLKETLNFIYKENPIYGINGYKANVISSDLGNDANLYGALYSFLKLEKEPIVS